MKKIFRKLVSKKPTSIPPEPDHRAYRNKNPWKHELKLVLFGVAGILIMFGLLFLKILLKI